MLPAPHPYRCLSSWRAAWYFHPLPSPTLPFRQPLIETNANTSPSLIGRPPPLLSLFHPGSYLSSNVVELDRKPGPFSPFPHRKSSCHRVFDIPLLHYRPTNVASGRSFPSFPRSSVALEGLRRIWPIHSSPHNTFACLPSVARNSFFVGPFLSGFLTTLCPYCTLHHRRLVLIIQFLYLRSSRPVVVHTCEKQAFPKLLPVPEAA